VIWRFYAKSGGTWAFISELETLFPGDDEVREIFKGHYDKLDDKTVKFMADGRFDGWYKIKIGRKTFTASTTGAL